MRDQATKINSKTKKTMHYESKRISRDDKRYKRIESFSLEDFNNRLYFEFFLRIPEFALIFDSCCKEILDAYNTKTFNRTIHDEIIPSYEDKFSKFNYDSQKVAYYIVSKVFPELNYSFEVKGYNNISIDSLDSVISRSFEKTLYDKFNVVVNANTSINYDLINYNLKSLDLSQEEELKKIISSEVRKFTEVNTYTTEIKQKITYDKDYNLNPLITVNLNNSKEATTAQVLSILNNLYSEKEESQKSDSVNIKTLIHKQNPQKAFADYFCIYDNLNLGIPVTHLASYFHGEKGQEPNTDTQISRVTVYRVKELMEQQLKNQNFLKLTI